MKGYATFEGANEGGISAFLFDAGEPVDIRLLKMSNFRRNRR